MEQEYIEINKQKIYFTIQRKKIKNINLRVNIDKKVYISVPFDMSIDTIKEFIVKKHKWINKQIEYYETFSEIKENINFENGETVFILGKQYLMNIVADDKNSIELKGKYIKIHVKEKYISNKKYLNKIYDEWLRNYAMSVYKEISAEFEKKLKRHKVKNPQIIIRKMNKRWGSCLANENKIILNLKLIKTPICCVEYVILHELCHFKYQNHSKQFYNHVNVFMPDWEERKKILDEEYMGVV